MNNWHHLAKQRYSAEKTSERGVSSRVAAFNIPDALRIFRDEETGEIVVQFRYLETSEKVSYVSSDGVRVGIGVNSRRVFEIRAAPATGQRKGHWFGELLGVLQSLSSKAPHRFHDNYGVTRQVIAESRNEISELANI